MLKGIVSMVTGGASGLGRATVEHFAHGGAMVTVCDLPNSKGEEIVEKLGANVVFSPCDVTVGDDIKASIALCKEKFGKLNLLVNGAGTSCPDLIYNPMSKRIHRWDEFARVQNVNLFGTFNFITSAVPLIAQNTPDDDGERGVIINVASIAAFDGTRGMSAYAASKGAVVGMTLPLARDLSSLGIRVITIAPGLFDTPLYGILSQNARTHLESHVLFPKRLGNPSEFAPLVQEIALNKMFNGETIRLDAGLRVC